MTAQRPRRRPDQEPAILEVEGVDFSYGAVQILYSVDLTVRQGERVALLGTNGAGKSTLLKVISGLVRPSAGHVRFVGEDVTHLTPEERVARGMTLVEGGRSTFPSLTVKENLRLGGYQFYDNRPKIDQRIDTVLDLFPELVPKLDDPAGRLSGGEQQMMTIGRAMVAGSNLIMIDELSLGVAPIVLAQIVKAVQQIVDSGRTVLLVEQSLNIAVELTDTAHFMEKGDIKYSGPSRELLDRGDLARSVFFGAAADK